MLSFRVSLKERSYPILVGRGIFDQAGPLIKKYGVHQKHALVVSQKAVIAWVQDRLWSSLSKEGFEASTFITPADKSSEAAKSQKVYFQLIKRLAACDGKDKSVFLIALGGGVIGDLTGFAAAVYRRGIPYVQLPTTLTAQVDSAIGGKTAIDLPEGKNLLGAIYQPALVLSDVEILNSLPDRYWSDGFAEIIKLGVIKDPSLFFLVEKHGKEAIRARSKLLEKIVFRCAKVKARIVEKDEFDRKGIRAVLNFGHTAGHAIEAASRYSNQYTHGEAVAIGMLIACDIAERLGILKDKRLTERLEKTLVRFGLPVYHRGLGTEALLKAVGYDKKTQGGINRFVLPVVVGKSQIVSDVSLSVITEAIQKRKG